MSYMIDNRTNSTCIYDAFNSSEHDSEYERIVNGEPGFILWGIVFVLLTIFGNIGNIVIIIVLKREPVMSTLTILLIGLAISDIAAPQANALLAFSHYHLASAYSNSIVFLQFNNIIRFIIQPLGTMFTMSSSWIITATTLFRLIAVMAPFKARTLINKEVALVTLILIFVMSLVSIIPIYASLVLRLRCTPDMTQAYSGFDFDLENSTDFFKISYMPVLQTLCFYLPWLTSLMLWFFLILSLRKTERNFSMKFAPMTNACPNSTHKSLVNTPMPSSRINNIDLRVRSYNRITLMVVVLCFINLICQLFTFVFIFELVYNKIEQDSFLKRSLKPTDLVPFPTAKSRFPKFLSYSLLLNNIFIGINHSCNIFIYTSTNPRFKTNLLTLFKDLLYGLLRVIYTKQQLNTFSFINFQQSVKKDRNVNTVQNALNNAYDVADAHEMDTNANPRLNVFAKTRRNYDLSSAIEKKKKTIGLNQKK